MMCKESASLWNRHDGILVWTICSIAQQSLQREQLGAEEAFIYGFITNMPVDTSYLAMLLAARKQFHMRLEMMIPLA